MIDAWCDWVRLMDPSIIAGHNIFSYDLIYLAHCAADNDTSLFLGRDNSDITFDKYESKFRKDGSQFYHYHKVHCYGRELIDTMFLSIKYDIGRKYESYGLKSIIDAEGLQVKDRVFYDAASIRHNYKIKEEWEKIKQYALHDADDALALFDLMAPSFFYLSQSVPKPFQMIIESASGSQINSMMIRSYLQDAHSLPKADEVVKFEGATSFGNIGIYKNVFKVDVASLYPSVMLHYNIHDSSKDPNANLSKILKIFTEERLKNKKLAKTDKYFSDLEQSQKIIINSMYGFMGAPGLLFNYPLGAAMVTERGREILADSIKWATAKELTIVNGDTDSISFCNNDRSEFTKETQDDLLKDLNSKFPSMIHWEHDGIYKSVIIIATKNYVLWDGVKLKYKGSAIKASTKEPALKEFIKVIIDAMLNDQDNYVEIYHRYVKEILDVKDMKRWASRKTLTEAVFSSPRLNETKIKDAVAGTEYVKGDRVYMYFLPDESLGLLENFDGNYNITTLLHKLYATGEIFSSILDTKTMFPNYKLKRNKEKLKEVS
jgi:DNA polymerase elongation subunit (family B)